MSSQTQTKPRSWVKPELKPLGTLRQVAGNPGGTNELFGGGS